MWEGLGRSYFLILPCYFHTFSTFTGGYLLRIYAQPGMTYTVSVRGLQNLGEKANIVVKIKVCNRLTEITGPLMHTDIHSKHTLAKCLLQLTRC